MRIFKDLDIWYVSFFTHGDPTLRGANRKYARATRSFKTEADAKSFAREIVENGSFRPIEFWTGSAAETTRVRLIIRDACSARGASE